MQTITFEQLPSAVFELSRKVDYLTALLTDLPLHALSTGQTEAPDLLVIKQASEVVNLAVPTIYGMVSRNEIPFMKRGKKLYFSRKELEDWIREGRQKTVDECAKEVRNDLKTRAV
ncbi:helix-turn-helix domain-containing protein [Spirosoma daeguense]